MVVLVAVTEINQTGARLDNALIERLEEVWSLLLVHGILFEEWLFVLQVSLGRKTQENNEKPPIKKEENGVVFLCRFNS